MSSQHEEQEFYLIAFRWKIGTPRSVLRALTGQLCPVLYVIKMIIAFIETIVTKCVTLLTLINTIILLISMIIKHLGHVYSPEFFRLVLLTFWLWSLVLRYKERAVLCTIECLAVLWPLPTG